MTPALITARATISLILSLALAETCTLCGFLSAHFLGAHVPERVLLPPLAAVIASARLFPTDARLRALAGATTAAR
jgi:hypothetical protein